MNEVTTILNAKGIEKRFVQGDAAIEVLDGVDLSVAGGERVAIVGRSGSGKSSLLHVLAGLDDVNQGQISLVGEPMAPASNDARTALRRNTWASSINSITCCQSFRRWKMSPYPCA